MNLAEGCLTPANQPTEWQQVSRPTRLLAIFAHQWEPKTIGGSWTGSARELLCSPGATFGPRLGTRAISCAQLQRGSSLLANLSHDHSTSAVARVGFLFGDGGRGRKVAQVRACVQAACSLACLLARVRARAARSPNSGLRHAHAAHGWASRAQASPSVPNARPLPILA